LFEMLDQILPLEDTEIAQGLEKILVKNGLMIKTSTNVSDIRKLENLLVLQLNQKRQKRNGAAIAA